MRKLITILLFNVAATATVAQDNFTELPTNVNGINLGSAEWVDYDGDGLLDIFITGFKIGDDDIDNGTIFRNLGDGTFEVVNITNITRIIYGDQDWGDLNNDGFLDLVVLGSTGGGSNGTITKTYLSDGAGSLVTTDMGLRNLFRGDVKIVDIDSDGDNDIFLTGFSSNERLYTEVYENVNGTFSKVFDFPISGSTANNVFLSSAWYDFDNDGDNDAVIGYSSFSEGYGVKYFVNNGDFNFEEDSEVELPQHNYTSMDVFDLNNDNLLDIVISGNDVNSTGSNGTTAYLTIMRNDGENNFTTIYSEELGVYFGQVDCGDFNNDGYSDIILNGGGNDAQRLYNLINNGDETFSFDLISNAGTYHGGALWGRLDSLSNLDFFQFGSSSFSSSDGISRLYENNSQISNQKPAVPVNITYEIVNDTLIVEWEQSTDDHTGTNGISYDVKFGAASQDYDIIRGTSNSRGYRSIYRLGNNGLKNKFYYPNLTPGTYYFEVQSIDNAFNGSEYSKEIEICNPRASLYDSLSICQFDSVLLDPGTFSSYSWIGGEVTQTIYAKEEGWYSVVVENSFGCVSKDSTFISVNPLPEITLPDSLAICDQESVELEPGTFEFYSWNTGEMSRSITVTEEGWYTVQVENSFGCTSKDSTYLTVYQLPILSLDDLTISEDDFIEIDGGEFASYEWSNGFVGGILQIQADTLMIGDNPFSLVVTDVNGCSTNEDFIITVEKVLGNDTFQKSYSVRINRNHLTVSTPSNNFVDWQVTSLDGKVNFRSKSREPNETVFLNSGIYIVKIVNQKRVETIKIFIK